jgi:hypothetical protein
MVRGTGFWCFAMNLDMVTISATVHWPVVLIETVESFFETVPVIMMRLEELMIHHRSRLVSFLYVR